MDNNQMNEVNQDVNSQTNENLNQQATIVQPEETVTPTEPVSHQEEVQPTQTVETPVEPLQEENQVPGQTAVQPQEPVAPQPEMQPQQAPVAPQPQMYQQQMPGAQQPKKKFNWVLWIAVAVIISIAIGFILKLVGNSIASGGAEAMPMANFVKSLGTLAMFLLTPPSVIVVVIIGIIKSNKN